MTRNYDPDLEYFIGVSLPKKERLFIAKLRKKFENRDVLSSPPHITIKPPFMYHFEKPLLEQLEKWTKQINSFTTTFYKVGSFHQKKYSTVFLAPNNNHQFIQLNHFLSDNIKYLPKNQNYVPHLTLANRIEKDSVSIIKRQIRNLDLKITIKVNSITLFQHQKYHPWKEKQSFPFG